MSADGATVSAEQLIVGRSGTGTPNSRSTRSSPVPVATATTPVATSPSLDAAAKAIRTLGLSNPNGLGQRMASLQQGADALADGSRKIADGLRVLDDQTKQLGEGLSRASA